MIGSQSIPTMNSDLFYADLPVLDDFLDITEAENFQPVPDEWYIAITDIVGSTRAIESGRYKDVNLLGACSIAAVLNIARNLAIPFAFGGDGATILIPPSLFVAARQALLATRQRAKQDFNLDLRVGAVPVADVRAAHSEVNVAKLKVSDDYYQAVFAGNGINYATELIKAPGSFYLFSDRLPVSREDADFSSLECRWQDIPSKHGEIVSLIVKATAANATADNQIYRTTIQTIQEIYGGEECLNPVGKDYLKLAFSYKYLKSETKARARSSHFWHQSLYFNRIFLENLLGWFFLTFKLKLPDTDWGAYKDDLIAATDYKKFDDMLRMVIAGNAMQRNQLTQYLEKQFDRGNLVYGLHRSDRALMTCLVYERNGRQVHFVDGADGGYAAAAKVMKQRSRF